MYNILGELTVCILSAVMLVNFINSFSLKEKRHRLFLCCILAVFVSTLINMFSVYFIKNFSPKLFIPATLVTTLYFFVLCTPALMIAVYTYDFASLAKRHHRFINSLIYVPLAVYLTLVLVNIKTGWIFRYDLSEGYVRGPLKYITYFTTAIYAFIVLGTTWHNRKVMPRKLVIVFSLYPVLCFGIGSIQFFFPHLIMTGAMAMTPMLLCYLTIQSDLLDYDLNTGLMTEMHLSNHINHTKNSSLCVIQIENYNYILETLGYNQTTFLMYKIAQKISHSFPKRAYHISNDRFAVVDPDMEKIKNSVTKICLELRNYEISKNAVYHVETCSVALSVPDNASNYVNAMELVSEMLTNGQKSRLKGEVSFLVCEEKYENKVRRNKMIYDILERELNVDSKQYQVYYQPIYSVGKSRFKYAEALSRLIGTEIGDIRPDEFISVAERKGLIEKLGNVAFEKICKYISENRDKIDAVSVNFSVNQLTNPDIVENVLTTINKYGISPKNIIMEITESIFIEDFENIREKMIQLAKAGIEFYLDDFGTGYSNFANVIELPFTTIKFDRSMLLTMEKNEDSRRLISSLINAFKQNGLNILVEGVENLTQDSLVREAGADYIQGFLYKRPLSPEACLEVFAS